MAVMCAGVSIFCKQMNVLYTICMAMNVNVPMVSKKSPSQQMAALWPLRSRTPGCPPSSCHSSYEPVDPGHVTVCDSLE